MERKEVNKNVGESGELIKKQSIMERKEVNKNVGESWEFDIGYGDDLVDIDEILSLINKAKSIGATHLEMWGSGYEGSTDSIDMQPIKTELESDEAYNKRTAKIRNNKLRKEEKEKRMYLMLRLKYGNGNSI